MQPILGFTRNRRIPLNLRRLVGGWLIRKSARSFELDVGSVFRGRRDNYIEWMVYVSGQYFEFPYLNLIRRLHQGGVVLDIGANVGNHALAFSEFFDRVYAVEPYPPVYDRLAARKKVSDRIHTFRIALSDHSGTVSFKAPDTDNLGIGRIAEDGDLFIETVSGDAFVAAEIQDRIDFIKIDVEGHEAEVVKGLAKTLLRDRPTVMFEASKAVMQSAESIRACFSLLPEDYVFFVLSGQSSWPIQRETARLRPIDTDRPKPSRHSCDILCWGREKQVDLVELNR